MTEEKKEINKVEIKCIRNGFKMEDAFQRLYKRSKHFTIENMDLLFYPYLLIEYEVKFRGKLEKLSETVLVLCDMWRGQFSMAKTAGDFTKIQVDESSLISVKYDKERAIKEGPRTVYGEIQAKKKVLNIPDIEYLYDELIYKPFYIVECKNDEQEVFHILFDAVNGDFSLLNA